MVPEKKWDPSELRREVVLGEESPPVPQVEPSFRVDGVATGKHKQDCELGRPGEARLMRLREAADCPG